MPEHDQHEQQRHAVAEDDPGEDVPADIVGAEPVRGGRRQVPRLEVRRRACTWSGYGVIQGARRAARMQMMTIAAPITAVGLREKRYQFW